MATLTEVAYYSRRLIKWGSITIVVLIVGRWIWSAFITYWRAKHPLPPPPPTVLFGKLPAITFPQKEQPHLTYTLQTITGDTPDLGDRSRVFFMPTQRANLLALERATEEAKKLGFVDAPQKVTDVSYRWTTAAPLSTTLDFDIVHGSFVLDTVWQQDPEIVSGTNLPNDTKAVLEAQEYLNTAGLLSSDLKAGRNQISFLKAEAGSFIPAISLSEAQFVRVDLFRENLDEGQVYTADSSAGLVQLIFSGAPTRGKRITRVVYNYFPVNYDQSATYPLKPSAIAWEELKAGQGFIASFTGTDTAIIRKVSLGFFDSLTPQNFLQPIYIFQGDNNFVGYVPAISSQWIASP